MAISTTTTGNIHDLKQPLASSISSNFIQASNQPSLPLVLGSQQAALKRAASSASRGPSGIRTPMAHAPTPSPQQRFALAKLKARKEVAVFFKSVESWNNEAALGSSLDDLSKVAKGIGGSSAAAGSSDRQMKKAMSIIPGANTDEANQAVMLAWDRPMFHKFRLFALLFTFLSFSFVLCALALNRFAAFGHDCAFGLWDISTLGGQTEVWFNKISNSSLMEKINMKIQGSDHKEDYSTGADGCTKLPEEFRDFLGWRFKVFFVYIAYMLSTLIACFAIIFAQCGRGGNLRKYVYRIHSTAELLVVNEFLLAGTTTYVSLKLKSEPMFEHYTMGTYMLLTAVATQTIATLFCSLDNILVTCSEVCCPSYYRRTQKYVASQVSTAAYRL